MQTIENKSRRFYILLSFYFIEILCTYVCVVCYGIRILLYTYAYVYIQARLMMANNDNNFTGISIRDLVVKVDRIEI